VLEDEVVPYLDIHEKPELTSGALVGHAAYLLV